MMADKGWLILISDGPWRVAAAGADRVDVGELPVAGSRLDADSAAELAQAMHQRGYGGAPIALGVPSSWLLAASISTDNLPRSNRRQAMAYRLEEQLPIAAEDLVADFAERNGRALGVAVEAGPLAEIIAQLESAHLPVQSVCPSAMLALQGLDLNGSLAKAHYAAMALDGRVDLAGIAGGRPRSFQSLPDDPADLARAFQAHMLLDGPPDGPTSVAAIGLDEPARSAVTVIDGAETTDVEGRDPVAAAASVAAAVLDGKRRPWFELRRGALAGADALKPIRRPLGACFALAVALLCVLTAGLLWRGWRYAAAADRLRAARQDVCAELYPQQRCPRGVRRRLESDARKLGSLRAVSADVPGRRSALESLRATVARLPGDVRLHILEVQIDPAGLVVDGKARSHGDA
ncbi:MAG: hypothetical protein ACYS5V_05210, partial [Planctomycetota bacterium]